MCRFDFNTYFYIGMSKRLILFYNDQVVRGRTVSESYGGVGEAEQDSLSPSKLSTTHLESTRSSSQTGKDMSGMRSSPH